MSSDYTEDGDDNLVEQETAIKFTNLGRLEPMNSNRDRLPKNMLAQSLSLYKSLYLVELLA